MSGTLILVGGGVRSGKSAFALHRAAEEGPRRVFLATGEPRDDAMRGRIERHRQDRDGSFSTLEEPRAVPEALRRVRHADVVVVDCLTLWLSNLMGDGLAEDEILARVSDLAAAAREAPRTTIVVTNEVGMSVHPETELGRRFQDVAGRAHALLARESDEIYAALMGCILRLRPGPVALVAPEEAQAQGGD